MTDDDLRFLLLRASSEPVGLAVLTNFPDRLRAKLYKPMHELNLDFELRIPPIPGELWLLRKKTSS